MKTATEKLRELLDERGVKWVGRNNYMGYTRTEWTDGTWDFEAVDSGHNDLSLYATHHGWITPEQAVEATLGHGECMRAMDSIGQFCMLVCDHCGHPIEISENFCGGCVRKVKQ